MKLRRSLFPRALAALLVCLCLQRHSNAQTHTGGWCTQRFKATRAALAAAEQDHGTNTHLIVGEVMAFADACALTEEYEAAKEAYARAAELQSQRLKGIHHDLRDRLQTRVPALNGVGAACLELRQFRAAEEAYNRAMANAQLILHPGSREVKVSRNGFSLARAYYMRFEVARDFYGKLLRSCINAFGEEDPEVCRVLDAQVVLYKTLEDLPAAKETARRVVELRSRFLPPNHPRLATSLNQLASILYERDQHDAVLPLLKQALEIRKHAFGEDHQKVAIALENIAAFLRDMGRQEEAAKYEAAARERADVREATP